MSKTTLRAVSVLTSLALLGGTAGIASIASAANEVTTNAASSITSSNATLNATNGTSAASGSAFWVTASSTALNNVASSSSPTLPPDTYSTGNLGSVAGSGAFSAQLSNLSIPAGFSAQSGTTYYFVPWVNLGGVWYPGAVMNFTTAAATASTTVSNVQVSGIGTSSATISWNTNNAGTGTVWYGTSSSYGSSMQSSTTASTSQSVTLTNLTPGTLYHFAVTGTDGTSTATTTDMTFTTASTGSSTPLAVTGVDAVKTTATADNTYANGWEWVMHLTVPNNENAFHIAFTDWSMNGNSSTTFPAGGNMQVWSAQSSNASTSAAAIGNSSNAYGGWLYLNGDTDNNAANGRQIDLHIMVKIPTGTAAGNYTTTYTAQSYPSSATSTASTTP